MVLAGTRQFSWRGARFEKDRVSGLATDWVLAAVFTALEAWTSHREG